MSIRVSYNNLSKVLEQRILSRIEKYQPDDPRLREGLTRIGIMIEREAKKNITQKKLVDTGSLLNSIRFRLFQKGTISGVKVGSYGIPYAAVHEFGFDGSVKISSHERRTPSGGVTNVTAHQRMMQIRARPYLKPAIKSVRKEIINILKGL